MSETIRMTQTQSEEEATQLRNKLIEYNKAYLGEDLRYEPLCHLLWNEGGDLVGGISGSTFMDLLRIDLLWLDDSLRGLGYGKQLLESAETFGREHGCRLVILDTFSFQAPEFYKRQGYEVFGTVTDALMKGVERYYFTKVL